RLKELGILRASISLDGPDATSHDAFRRVAGAFAGALRGIGHLRDEGLPFQVNTTVTRHNVGTAEKIYELACSLQAVAWHPFLLVPTGRGAELAKNAIGPAEYEDALRRFYRLQCEGPIPLKVTCAPHYARVAREEEKKRREARLPVREMEMTRGCLAGTGFAFVSHVGRVQTCGYLDVACGDIRKEPFTTIWETSRVFRRMRSKAEHAGRCGACPYWKFCGGCRARAFEVSGDYMAEEPHCVYVPPGFAADCAPPTAAGG
ncbi:MAG: SPASM domain-containing protein, partial [Deltaproteobacteria bacterium]|nr:SPASM domain-containing protein [Deltaproteobacteria bacterium]